MTSILPHLPPWDDSLFATVVDAAVNGVIAVSDQGLIRVFNSACEAMFHYRREEVLGRDAPMLLASPYREEYAAYFLDFQHTGQLPVAPRNREINAQRKDGSEFPVLLSVGAGEYQSRPVFVAVIHDLTAVQTVYAEERAFLAAIVDSSNDAIVSKTLDGKITSWNRAAEMLFGYTAAEMIGTPITRLFPEDRLDEEMLIMGKIRGGSPVERYETIRLRKDGSPLDVAVTISPIRGIAGRVIGASKTVRDITERKQTEARLRSLSSELNHVARLSEMGQVSAALAHELNQPLTAVLNYTNLAKRLIVSEETHDKQRTLDAVTKAGEQAVRAGHIIRHLRDFVEKRESSRTLEDINAVIEDAMALGLIGTKAADIQVITDFASDLPSVLVDKVQIQQVLVNLLRNAAEAMAHTPRRELTLTTDMSTDGSVAVRVTDTGTGIPGAIAEQLFRPFVTTKPGGMGIGLAISRSIIESHGGRLTVAPNPGGGTVFQFTLPPMAPMVE